MDNDHAAVIIGAPGVRRRARETGAAVPLSVKRIILDPSGIREGIRQTRAFFGETLAELEKIYRRSLGHKKTPPKKPHRLPELIDLLERNVESIEQGGRETEILAAVELKRAVDLYQRWQHDPYFPALMAAARDPNNFRHDLTLLAAASCLADTGLGSEFLIETDRRAADLRIVVSLRHAFRVEVKAPDLAREIEMTGLTDRGRKLVRNALENALEQLGSLEPGVLLIGGPFWTGQQLDALRDEARDLLTQRGSKHKGLAAVLVVSTTAEAHRRSGTEGLPFDWSLVDFMATISARWIDNPGYSGHLKLQFPENFVGPFSIAFRP